MRALQIFAALTIAAGLGMTAGSPAFAADTFTVQPVTVLDEKAVFATVESANIVPARARIGGTVAELSVHQGDRVEQNQIVATIGDEKLVLQLRALDSEIDALKAKLTLAQSDLERKTKIFKTGGIPKADLDQAQADVNVASGNLKALIGKRSVVEQQLAEGSVLAPRGGRVLTVPVTAGTVVLPGEPIATIAEQDFVLRIRVPERHARFLKVGDPIRLDGGDLGVPEAGKGSITLIYPQIADGRVVADARVPGLTDYFVGERVRIWVSGGERQTFVVPAAYVATRFGIDYVKLQQEGDKTIDVPVQRGRALAAGEGVDGIEILSGVAADDVLVLP